MEGHAFDQIVGVFFVAFNEVKVSFVVGKRDWIVVLISFGTVNPFLPLVVVVRITLPALTPVTRIIIRGLAIVALMRQFGVVSLILSNCLASWLLLIGGSPALS